jgi:N-acetylmuramoyl-L-alanine amidase
MKNTNMKTFFVACVATISFLGVKNSAVEAKNLEYSVVNGERIEQHDQRDGKTNEGHKPDNHWINQEEMLQLSYNPIELVMESLEPITEITTKKTETEEKPVEVEVPPVKEPVVEEPEQPAVSISNQEKDLFARLVEAEAKGEPYEGKVAVATVVLNRVDSPEFPDTVTDVIKEKVGSTYAFSPVQNGEIQKPASPEAQQAVDEALTRQDRLNESVYFYNPEIASDNWIRTRDEVKSIGNHVFAK